MQLCTALMISKCFFFIFVFLLLPPLSSSVFILFIIIILGVKGIYDFSFSFPSMCMLTVLPYPCESKFYTGHLNRNLILINVIISYRAINIFLAFHIWRIVIFHNKTVSNIFSQILFHQQYFVVERSLKSRLQHCRFLFGSRVSSVAHWKFGTLIHVKI
jgi:hypothetical protein